jgi:hypothetical protein
MSPADIRTVQLYMHDMVQERKNSDRKVDRYDLFSYLLDANEGDSEIKLDDSEVFGV